MDLLIGDVALFVCTALVLNAPGLDAAAALVVPGGVVAAAAEERFTREKATCPHARFRRTRCGTVSRQAN